MYTLDHILPLAMVSDEMPLTLFPSTLTLAYFHVLQAACVTKEGKLDLGCVFCFRKSCIIYPQ